MGLKCLAGLAWSTDGCQRSAHQITMKTGGISGTSAALCSSCGCARDTDRSWLCGYNPGSISHLLCGCELFAESWNFTNDYGWTSDEQRENRGCQHQYSGVARERFVLAAEFSGTPPSG